MKSILLIENTNQASLMPTLSGEGYQVQKVNRIAEAERALCSGTALVILDWRLDDGRGVDFVKALRDRGVEIPVVMVSPQSDVMDRVMGLEAGANDCVSLPCEPRELVARVRAQLRWREPAKKGATLASSGIRMDTTTREVTFRGEKVTLRKMEYDLLKLFLEHPNRAFTREEILNLVWGYERFPTTRTIDTHMLAIRQKFESYLFETVRGVGYRFCPDVDQALAA